MSLSEIVIARTGNSKIVYRPLQPLDCGAVCWIETKDEVVVL